MKKLVFIICLFFMAAAVFGREFYFSTGAGGLFGGYFSRYSLYADGIVQGTQIKIDAKQEMNQLNYRFFAFFDAIYGVFSVFYQNGINNFKETSGGSMPTDTKSGKGWDSVMGFSFLGKYPLNITGQFTVFPLLGVEYQITLSQKRTQPDGYVYDRNLRETDKDGNLLRLEDWNSFWINIGGGLDFTLSRNIFVRSELLYGFRLMTPYEVKNLDMVKSMAGDPSPKFGGLTSGPWLRLSAGYRFLSN